MKNVGEKYEIWKHRKKSNMAQKNVKYCAKKYEIWCREIIYIGQINIKYCAKRNNKYAWYILNIIYINGAEN